MSKTALVLSGGASRGAYQLGVWQAINELKIPIDIVTGTSIGAVNGAMIAQKDFDTAKALWDTLKVNQLFNIDEDDPPSKILGKSLIKVSKTLLKEGRSDVKLLLNVLEPYLDEEKIRNSSIEYGLVTINIDEKMSPEYFIEDIPKGQLLDYIYGSSSVSPAFKPYVIGDHRFVDGCYFDNLPVSMALRKKADKIIAVNLEAFGVVHKKLIEKTLNLTLIRSHWDLGPTFFFDPDKIHRNTHLGYLDGLKAFHYYDGQAYAFSLGTAKDLRKKILNVKNDLPFIDIDNDNEKNFFQQNRRASKTLFLYLRKRLINKWGLENILLAWAENAGELFELDPCQLYDLHAFNKTLLKNYQKTCELELPSLPDLPGIEEISKIMGSTGIAGFATLRIELSLFKESIKALFQKESPQRISKRSTTKYLVNLLRENMFEAKSLAISNLASLLPAEFLAALYIIWLEDYQGV